MLLGFNHSCCPFAFSGCWFGDSSLHCILHAATLLPEAAGDCVGEHFVAVFGSNQSALETVLLKRKVMMPCWLSLKQPTRVNTSAQVSPPHITSLAFSQVKTLMKQNAVPDVSDSNPVKVITMHHLNIT